MDYKDTIKKSIQSKESTRNFKRIIKLREKKRHLSTTINLFLKQNKNE
jgi:hypothetical protein